MKHEPHSGKENGSEQLSVTRRISAKINKLKPKSCMQMAFGGWGDVLFITIQLKGVCMVGEIVIEKFEVSRLNLTITKSYKPILWMSRMLYIDIVSTQRLESRPRISSNDRESEKPNDE